MDVEEEIGIHRVEHMLKNMIDFKITLMLPHI